LKSGLLVRLFREDAGFQFGDAAVTVGLVGNMVILYV